MSTQSLWAADALWPGPAIVARLRDQVPDLRTVTMLDELDLRNPGTALRQYPGALVMLDQLRPNDTDAVRATSVVAQDWVVAIAVRSARMDADANSQQIGGLIPQVVSALKGWVPDGQLRAFSWRPALRPNYGRDVSYYPLVFSIQAVTA